jgi:hypothetical protein
VATLASTISAEAATIATEINGFTAQLAPAVQNASLEVQQVNQVQHDLSAFGPGRAGRP